jgi:hypothetical protein
VLSPIAKGMPEFFGMPPRPWRMSPNVAANIGIPDFGSHPPASVPSQMQKLVRELSDSIRKQGLLSRFGLESTGNVESSPKRGKMLIKEVHLVRRYVTTVRACLLHHHSTLAHMKVVVVSL